MNAAIDGHTSVYRSKDSCGWEGMVSFGTEPLTGQRLRTKVRGRTKSEVFHKLVCLVDEHTTRDLLQRGALDGWEHQS